MRNQGLTSMSRHVGSWEPGRCWVPHNPHSQPGSWILAAAQSPGDTIGSENITDGLGLALTAMVWIVLGYSLTLASSSPGIAGTEVAASS